MEITIRRYVPGEPADETTTYGGIVIRSHDVLDWLVIGTGEALVCLHFVRQSVTYTGPRPKLRAGIVPAADSPADCSGSLWGFDRYPPVILIGLILGMPLGMFAGLDRGRHSTRRAEAKRRGP